MSGNDWQQKERSTSAAIIFIAWVARFLGRIFGRVLLYPITLYYFMFSKKTRVASRDYHAKLHGPTVSRKTIFWHIHCFASVILDRVVLLTGGLRKLDITINGKEVIERYIAQGQGCLFFVSHVGSFDIMRVAGDEMKQLPVKILMNKRISGKLMNVLDTLNPGLTDMVVDISDRGPELIFKVKNALDDGSMVGLMVDRTFSADESVLSCDFLGTPALFPKSPWMLAAATKVPVIACFGLYEGGNRYTMNFVEITPAMKLNRKDKDSSIQPVFETYVRVLEQQLQQAPNNWFNFYDFWKQ